MATRNTVQRSIIEGTLRSLANHPSADEVYEAVHAKHPTISKATVYRTLGRLADEGVIGRVRINNGADRFDHQTFAHYHVRCIRCGRVDDVVVPVLDERVERMAERASGYAICGHTLQFDGVCPACQAGEKDEKAQRGDEASTVPASA